MPFALMIFALVLGAAFIVVGACIKWDEELTLRKATPVSAEILASTVGNEPSPDPEKSGELVYFASITYQMNLDSGPVISSRVYPADGHVCYGTAREAQAVADQFPVGKTVQAMADRTNPSRSYLIAQRSPTWWIMAMLGVVTGGMGVANYLTKGSKYNP